MVAPQDGTYNIQRSSDNEYLAIVGTLVTTSPDAYKWTIKLADNDQFYIQDEVTENYLYDNGKNGYITKPIQNANSRWQSLSIGPATKIYNQATKKSLEFPYGSGDLKWTVVKP